MMMYIKRGVSSVVAVLLMVILTVILSAVFGVISSHLAQKIEPAPVTMLDVQLYRDTVVIKHVGGDPFNIRFANLVVTTRGGTYRIPFLENYLSRDVILEIGDAKAVMLNECDCFNSYGRVMVVWKNKVMEDVAKGVVNKWYSPSFVVGYRNTLGVDSFLGVVKSENGIVAVGSKYFPPPYVGLITFLDEFGNVRKAYSGDFTFRDVAKCSDGYIVVGYKYAIKVNDSGGVVWSLDWRYHIRSVTCKGDICALAGFRWTGGYARIVLIDANNGERLSPIISHNLQVDIYDEIPIRVFSVKDGWLVVGRTSGGYGFAGLFDDNLNPIFMKWFSNTYAIRGGTESDDGFILVGTTTGEDDVAVIKINRQGNVIWAKKYDAGGSYEVAFSVYCDRASRICLVVGHTNAGGNPPNLFVLKIDEVSGRLLDSKIYDFGYSEFFDVVKPIFDYENRFRGFIGGGRVGSDPAVVRINIEGEIWGGSSHTLSIDFSESNLNTLPNSVTGYLTLSISPTQLSLSLTPTSVTPNEICKCSCYP